MDAAKVAGLEVLRILSEPTAAAMAAGFHEREGEEFNVVVFDFGGGTFDVSILQISNTTTEVLSRGSINVEATAGDMLLGGRDLDNSLVDYCLKQFKQATGNDLSQDKQIKKDLCQLCEKAKIELSSQEQATVIFEGLEIVISRAIFETECKSVLEKLQPHVESALNEAGYEADEIDEVLLVGGSSRIPWVKTMLRELFDKEPCDDVNADTIVGQGATVMAGILGDPDAEPGSLLSQMNQYNEERKVDQKRQTLVLQDVTPLSLGIRCAGDAFDVVVNRNQAIPLQSEAKRYATNKKNQKTISIDVRQGESKQASKNHSLGKFKIKDIPDGEAMAYQFDIIFKMDENNLLKVFAKPLNGQNQMEFQIKPENFFALTQEEVALLVAQGDFNHNLISFGEDDSPIVNR